MLSKKEFEEYKELATSIEEKKSSTMSVLLSDNPNEISKLGAKASVYYARVGFELVAIKDEINTKVLELIEPAYAETKPKAVNRAEKEAEEAVNAEHEVSRREADYLHAALDKLTFACNLRVKALSNEFIQAGKG